jgi:hypothetical protein
MKKVATRCVFFCGKYALKIPRLFSWKAFLTGMLANLQEREFRNLAPELTAKVYYADIFGLLLIMERADYMMPSNPNIYAVAEAKELFKQCHAAGVPCENKVWDVGRFGKKLKLVDFGS